MSLFCQEGMESSCRASQREYLKDKMPPEVPFHGPLLIPIVRSPSPDPPVSHKNNQKRMNFHGKKLILVLVFILISFSILRLLRIALITSPLSPFFTLPQSLKHTCSFPSLGCSQNSSNSREISNTPPKANTLTEKEFRLLADLIQRQKPCNLLIFGLEPEYLKLSRLNEGGFTIFLEDDSSKISKIKRRSNRSRIYKVEYHVPAKDAYKLLKYARQKRDCTPRSSLLHGSKCKLALTNLPKEVYNHKWDVVVVDGPSGDSLEAPGRMGTIYTASRIARAGNVTHVVVHDVHRTIEKWFSWEFLCEENLVSSKGKLWNFRITGQTNSSRFCPI